ncbi:TetR family transcriptional regulator [Actinorhabdospora filicis]|uniref:TetR family transcriptional regulator n=1 Tax=Actinorhabdospora filicis TaxID=1785913 RepID=A0A9W6SFI2_9ACTN|nr:TetR/AcrR family transcriptional regulator [Actinorhabdospora filicis]GLZ76214.1 TetR family transcriptional regulator [Actinorhabdospora filicis]
MTYTDRETAILDAVHALVTEIGYDAMRIDQVAARAHASKATIYRRWKGKAELTLECMRRMHPPTTLVESSGSLRTDLMMVLHDHVTGKKSDHAFVLGISAAMQRDDELREMVQRELVRPFRDSVRLALEWAAERGEVSPAVLGVRMLPDVIPAMCARRRWMEPLLSDDEFYEELIETIVMPLCQAAAGSGWRSGTEAARG